MEVAVVARVALLIAAPLIITHAASAQVTKGQRVALRVPQAAFRAVEHNGWWALEADGAAGDSGVVINGRTDWRGAGFLAGRSTRVKNVSFDKKHGRVEVELDQPKGPDLTLHIAPADTGAVFAAIAAPAADSFTVRAEGREAIRRRLFAVPLGTLELATQDRILAVCDSVLGTDSLSVVQFQGRPYIQVFTPASAFVYNENQTSDGERQAGVLNEVAFRVLRELAEPDSSGRSDYGFVVIATIASKSFAGRYAGLNAMHREDIKIFARADLAHRFALADLTSQDLVDSSVVMTKGNRVKVDLTK